MEPFSKYVYSKLDREYTQDPGDIVEENELPAEELEIRKVLSINLQIWLRLSEITKLYSLLNRKHSAKMKEDFINTTKRLVELVDKSPEHRAAMHRILSLMPEQSESRDFYSKFLGESGFSA